MKLAVDLHIHSALSPCADNEMTPNNIVNMAILKGLDVIAIADHHCAENVAAVSHCAIGKNILVIPGMEIETREEIHFVCLFRTVEEAMKIQTFIEARLPDIMNREDIFGQQLIMNQEDQVIGKKCRMLLATSNIGIEELYQEIEKQNGIMIPAHIDRNSYSILSNLGRMPEYPKFSCVEVTRQCNVEEVKRQLLVQEEMQWICSSDAHYLGDLLEREVFLEVKEKSIDSLMEALHGHKKPYFINDDTDKNTGNVKL